MPVIKTYHVAKQTPITVGTRKTYFVEDFEKVSEQTFNDLLKAKITELITPEKIDEFDNAWNEVYKNLNQRKPVGVLDRNFKIIIKKKKD